MKKIISLFLSIILVLSIFNISVYAVENTTNEEDVDGFCEDLNEMVNDYADSEFVTPDSSVIEETVAELGEETEVNFCSRLIVQSDNKINTYNAIDVVSGFSNFYILQFENEKDTNYAYEQYKADEKIISVSYDVSYNAFNTVTEEPNEEVTSLTYEDYKNAWYLNSSGIDDILEKYKNKKLPKTVIAVIDTGIDLNCKYLQERIERTYFNSSGENDNTSEQDYNGHGTMVSSMIANCSSDNVKIAAYRAGTHDGHISTTGAASAILKAVDDGISIINCSFYISYTSELINEIIDLAYLKQCFIIVSAGNRVGNITIYSSHPLNCSPKTITVGSSNKYHIPAGHTAYGKPVDVLAPGENVEVISLNDSIEINSGTSFAAPYMVAVAAMHCLVYPQISFEERMRILKNSGHGTDEKYVTSLFGSGIVDALKLFKLDELETPTFSALDEKIIGEVSLEIFAEDGADIYYTTDYTYPSPSNGTLYTEPIKIYDDFKRIRAVAYKNGKRSCFVKKDIYSFVLGTDDMFEINNSGVITSYSGKVNYLKIPEVINGITVRDISFYSGFNTAEIYGVILPDGVEYIGCTLGEYERPITDENAQIGAFENNQTIEFIGGNGIKVIGVKGVANNTKLRTVDFPNCKTIMSDAFYQSSIVGVEFPSVETINNFSFYDNNKLREIYLPTCKEIGYNSFENTYALNIIYTPKIDYLSQQNYDDNIYTPKNPNSTKNMFFKSQELVSVDFPCLQTIGFDFFQYSAIKEVNLSKVEYIYNLPTTMYDYNENSKFFTSVYSPYYYPVSIELVLPSTLKCCVSAEEYKYPEYNSFCVYGTKSTYAEEWAKENEIEFIEITQETAIREDIEPIWDEWSYNPLEFDARGFNRTYQWYGYNKAKENAVAIKGATDKTFNPEDYKQYEYYYCVMTSVDGDSVVTVTSGTCHNKMYNMFAIKDTYIDYDNNLIYTQQSVCKNINEIVEIQNNSDYVVIPSFSNKNLNFYGTGSQIVFTEIDGTVKTYTLIVQGDVNGDSVCDVLDCMLLELAITNNKNLDGVYFTAGDLAGNGEITEADFNAVVNKAVA